MTFDEIVQPGLYWALRWQDRAYSLVRLDNKAATGEKAEYQIVNFPDNTPASPEQFLDYVKATLWSPDGRVYDDVRGLTASWYGGSVLNIVVWLGTLVYRVRVATSDLDAVATKGLPETGNFQIRTEDGSWFVATEDARSPARLPRLVRTAMHEAIKVAAKEAKRPDEMNKDDDRPTEKS